ncbi:conserved hypothetical protein [Trichinella spiralis]|uniref:hypothetical protein n=1 Tax=Trichinella spiralis TaxID=6334 RepID=UPI0001EFB5C9|nr:conserved hypothetical protein [Trichinella spiralis]
MADQQKKLMIIGIIVMRNSILLTSMKTMNRIVIRYSCMMLHPSSIRFITFIVLRRQISKKRVEAVDMRGNKDQSECSEFEVMTIEIIFVAVLLYAAASVATLKRLIYHFDSQL